jgi:SAM-dependent methyltransferase
MEDLLATCNSDEVLPIINRTFKPGDRLIEAGCGAGRWVRFLTDAGYQMVGLEYSDLTVTMVNDVWPDLEVVQGDCQSSQFQDSSFDGALSFGVVEHWQEGPAAPLLDLFRILKPGGKAVITVPCNNKIRQIKQLLYFNELIEFPLALLKTFVRRQSLRPTRYSKARPFAVFPTYGNFFEYRMTPKEFAHELRFAGFEILEHIPTAHMDGIFHELNPFKILVKWDDWKFRPSRFASYLNQVLSKNPFLHPHMQAVVVQKPNTDAT